MHLLKHAYDPNKISENKRKKNCTKAHGEWEPLPLSFTLGINVVLSTTPNIEVDALTTATWSSSFSSPGLTLWPESPRKITSIYGKAT